MSWRYRIYDKGQWSGDISIAFNLPLILFSSYIAIFIAVIGNTKWHPRWVAEDLGAKSLGGQLRRHWDF